MTVKARITNGAPGPRGVWANGELLDIQPGQPSVLTFRDVKELGEVDKATFKIETNDDVDFDASPPKRAFLALADDENHTGFRLLDIGSAKMVGIAFGDASPILPGGFHWSPLPTSLPGEPGADEGLSMSTRLPRLTGKNKDQLLQIASDEGVEIEDGATNNDIVAAIELHREAAAQV